MKNHTDIVLVYQNYLPFYFIKFFLRINVCIYVASNKIQDDDPDLSAVSETA
jgi:hypothetical protein